MESQTITPIDVIHLRGLGVTASDPAEIEAAEMRLGAIRRECNRANRAERRFSMALWWGGGYAAFATAGMLIAFYLYFWGAR